MTPEEKAKELVEKMYESDYCGINHFPNNSYCECTEINYFQAKQCALIAVDEILEETDTYYDTLIASERKLFLEEVKQEIEKL